MAPLLPSLFTAALCCAPCCVLQVCQVSGLIINDEESRLQDHYSGRNYK